MVQVEVELVHNSMERNDKEVDANAEVLDIQKSKRKRKIQEPWHEDEDISDDENSLLGLGSSKVPKKMAEIPLSRQAILHSAGTGL